MFMMNEIAIGGMCAVLITVLSRDEKPIEDVKEMHEHNSRLYTMWTSAENPFLEAYSTVFVLRQPLYWGIFGRSWLKEFAL